MRVYIIRKVSNWSKAFILSEPLLTLFNKDLVMSVFFNSLGKPTAFVGPDGETNYLFSGFPVGYFHENRLFSFSGRQLGWFENGWIRDLNGNYSFFTDASLGGPAKPPTYPLPPFPPLRPIPPKGPMQPLCPFAPCGVSWSRLSGEAFFTR